MNKCCLVEMNRENKRFGPCADQVSHHVWSSKMKTKYKNKKMSYSTLTKNEFAPHEYICQFHKNLVTIKKKSQGCKKNLKRKNVTSKAYFVDLACEHACFMKSCRNCLLRRLSKNGFRQDYSQMKDASRKRERLRMLDCAMEIFRLKESDLGMKDRKFLSLHECASVIVGGPKYSSRTYGTVRDNMKLCDIIMFTYEECKIYLKELVSDFKIGRCSDSECICAVTSATHLISEFYKNDKTRALIEKGGWKKDKFVKLIEKLKEESPEMYTKLDPCNETLLIRVTMII